MKWKGLIAVFVCIVMLSGCNSPTAGNGVTGTSNGEPSVSSVTDNLQPLSPPDLTSEQGIKEYLVGEWVFNKAYVSNIDCNMRIDADLKVHLSFYDNTSADKSKGDYTGQISFDRAYATADEVPDLICIDLTDTDDVGGNFLFRHRSVYDGKRVMSWFFAGLESSVFDMLGPDESVPDEIIFEKASGEKSSISPRNNDEFYAVFWGKGVKGENLWLDDVRWTPPAEDDFATLYPRQMTLYENDVPESVLYTIASVSDILRNDLIPGAVYFVQTDKQGNITLLKNATYKADILDESGGRIDPATEALVFDIIQNDIQEYLDLGMAILFTGETTIVNGEDCYDIAVGTNHEEHFVREIHYAVNISTQQVYRYDVIMDTWEELPQYTTTS